MDAGRRVLLGAGHGLDAAREPDPGARNPADLDAGAVLDGPGAAGLGSRTCAALARRRSHVGRAGVVDAAELWRGPGHLRSEEHTSELQSRENLVCRLLL